MKQRVSVLVNECHREVGLILTGFRLDDRAVVVYTPMFTDTLRVAILPFGSVDYLHRHAEVISGIRECGHQTFAVSSGLGF